MEVAPATTVMAKAVQAGEEDRMASQETLICAFLHDGAHTWHSTHMTLTHLRHGLKMS